MQSKSTQQNTLNSNVWSSGFKTSKVLQESPFLKTGKDSSKYKASKNCRNTILVEDGSEIEALNNKLIKKTKYVDKGEKSYNEYLKTGKEFDSLVKECYADIDTIVSKKEKN